MVDFSTILTPLSMSPGLLKKEKEKKKRSICLVVIKLIFGTFFFIRIEYWKNEKDFFEEKSFKLLIYLLFY